MGQGRDVMIPLLFRRAAGQRDGTDVSAQIGHVGDAGGRADSQPHRLG
jgi:hypothetical protein